MGELSLRLNQLEVLSRISNCALDSSVEAETVFVPFRPDAYTLGGRADDAHIAGVYIQCAAVNGYPTVVAAAFAVCSAWDVDSMNVAEMARASTLATVAYWPDSEALESELLATDAAFIGDPALSDDPAVIEAIDAALESAFGPQRAPSVSF